MRSTRLSSECISQQVLSKDQEGKEIQINVHTKDKKVLRTAEHCKLFYEENEIIFLLRSQ